MTWLQSFIMLLGRICIAAFFFYVTYETIVQWETSLGMYQQQRVSQPRLFLIILTIAQFLGACSLLLGWKTRIGAFLLLVVIGLKTYLLYDFWNAIGHDNAVFHYHLVMFSVNTGLFGGLLYVLCCGSGSCSWDHCGCSSNIEHYEEEGH